MPTEELYQQGTNNSSADIPADITTEDQTSPTRSVTLADIKESEFGQCYFVYNRFEATERISRYEFNTSNEISNVKFENYNAVEDALISRYSSPPRYNVVSFSHTPGAENSTSGLDTNNFPLMAKSAGRNGVVTYLRDLISNLKTSQILSEGGLYNFFYSGLRLIDTNLDEKYFKRITDQVKFLSIVENSGNNSESLTTRKLLNDTANRTSNTDTTNQINTVLGMLSQKHINPSQRNVEYLKSVRELGFNLVFNNLCFDNVMMASTANPNSIYNDELLAYKQYTSEIYKNVKQSIDSRRITDADFETQIGSSFLYDYSVSDMDSSPGESSTPPGIVHAGYLIDKTEFDPITGSETILPSQIVGSNFTKLIDTDIAYGKDYIYTVKSLYAMEYDCLIDGVDEYFRCVFVLASKGVTKKLKCVEYEPPKPPQSLRFKYDHKQKALLVTWEFPPNPQGDIKNFQVFRRDTIDNPYTLIKFYDFDNTVGRMSSPSAERPNLKAYTRLEKDGQTYAYTQCLDYDFNKNSEFLYAVGCSDAHGMLSNLSTQFKVKFNNKTKKVDASVVIGSNAPRCYPNIFLNNDTVQDAIKVSNKNRMTIYFDPDVYKITKKRIEGINASPQKVIAESDTVTAYKINFINTDLQKNSVLNINVKNIASEDSTSGLPPLEPSNLSFTVRNY